MELSGDTASFETLVQVSPPDADGHMFDGLFPLADGSVVTMRGISELHSIEIDGGEARWGSTTTIDTSVWPSVILFDEAGSRLIGYGETFDPFTGEELFRPTIYELSLTGGLMILQNVEFGKDYGNSPLY